MPSRGSVWHEGALGLFTDWGDCSCSDQLDPKIAALSLADLGLSYPRSAVDAVRQWKYRPSLLNRQAVAVRTEIEVHCELRRF